jgi:hypothetical protein
MDAAHALLKAGRIPGQIVIDHKVTELQIDALTGSLSGYQDIGIIFKD